VVALAWLLALAPALVAVPGARRPEAVADLSAAAALALTGEDLAELGRGFGHRPAGAAPPATPAVAAQPDSRAATRDVVMVMGIPGAGKTRHARALAADGALRLNRDERGGTLRDLAADLTAALDDGADRRIVIDNTYLTRAQRSHVIDAAAGRGVPVRCIWHDTPLAQAQVNLVLRLLDVFGHLPTPEELAAAARRRPGLHTPTSQMRTVRELEIPTPEEGFAAVERITFTRERPDGGTPAVVVAASAVGRPGWRDAVGRRPAVPHLLLDWRPGAGGDPARSAEALASVVAGALEVAVCRHPGGPPRCWCRPPLPGLALEFGRRHDVDWAVSTVVGSSPAHRALAAALGAGYVAV
jgi:predicted kinase